MRLPPLIPIFLALAFSALAAGERTGTIEGRIANAVTGNLIRGARVAIPGTALETFTNDYGEYRLSRVPAGGHPLTVVYTGFVSETKNVRVTPDEASLQDFQMTLVNPNGVTSDAPLRLAAYTVTDHVLSSQAAALNAQRNAANIKNVVSFSEYGEMGEANPAEFLKYVPGITVGYGPEGASTVAIRGMSGNGTVVMIDGAPITSASGDRVVNFQKSHTSNIAYLEVNKVPTPDIPANAVGGSVNMVKKSGFSRSTPYLRYSVFSLFNTLSKNNNVSAYLSPRPGVRFDARPTQPGGELDYIFPVNKTVAFTFSLAANRRYYDVDIIQPIWNHVTKVDERFLKSDVINMFDRKFIAASMDVKVGKYGALRALAQHGNVKTMGSTVAMDLRFGAGAIGGADFSESRPGAGVVAQSFNGDTAYNESNNFNLRYTHDGANWKWDAAASYNDSYVIAVDTEDSFLRTLVTGLGGLNLRADGMLGVADGYVPRVSATTTAGAVINPLDGRNLPITSVTSQPQTIKDSILTLGGSVTREFATVFPLSVRLGVNQERRDFVRTQSPRSWTFAPPGGAGSNVAGRFDLINTAFSGQSRWRDVQGRRTDVQWLSAGKMYDLFRAHPEFFVLDAVSAHSAYVNASKAVAETITASYLRLDGRLIDNRLKITTGVRYEETVDDGEGPLNNVAAVYARDATGQIARNPNGTPIFLTTDLLARAQLQFKERGSHSHKSYDGFHPSLNTAFSIKENLLLRTGYARTIGRPSLGEIIPGVVFSNPTVTTATPSVTVINSALKPWTANNYDVSLELYNTKAADMAVSVFRKDIENFFASTTSQATPELLAEFGLDNEYSAYNIVTKRNRGNARITGLEWSWRQRLTFLPAWARGLQAYMNGTYMRLSGPNSGEFTGFRSRAINFGVTLSRPKFLVQINGTLGTNVQQGPVAPSVSIPPNTVMYTAGVTTVDLSAEYKLTKRLSLFGSVRNLTQASADSYVVAPDTPDYARLRIGQRFGSLVTFGIKGEF